jgi:quercetin dioxygenase-like cupin family protein
MIEIDLGIVHHFSSGVYAKEMHLPAGHFAVTHSHNYDHLSILAQGIARVITDGVVHLYEAPACVLIKAGVHHRIEAQTATTWFCVHRSDVTDPSLIDEVLIRS